MKGWGTAAVIGVLAALFATGACGRTSSATDDDLAAGNGGMAGHGVNTGGAINGSTGGAGLSGGSGASGTGASLGEHSDASVASGGTGGSSGPGGSGSSGASDAAYELDPFAEERRQTVTNYCALLETHECLSYFAQRGTVTTNRDEMIEACRQDLEVQQDSIWGDACFDEWKAVLECLTAAPWTCPCSANDCTLAPPGTSPGPLNGVCDAPAAALSECAERTAVGEVLNGAAGECYYYQSQVDGCYVQCYRDVGVFESSCDGPAGGAQACSCLLNGVGLRDPANDSGLFWGDNCVDAAQLMADGYCDRILDCCFTWVKDGQPQCTCTSDPTAGGFSSCEAAAAAGGGEVVALCPQYQIAWAEFPQP